MVQSINNVKRKYTNDTLNNSSYDKKNDEVIDLDNFVLDESGGHVSNNLLGLSSTLGDIFNLEGVSLGTEFRLNENLSSVTENITGFKG